MLRVTHHPKLHNFFQHTMWWCISSFTITIKRMNIRFKNNVSLSNRLQFLLLFLLFELKPKFVKHIKTSLNIRNNWRWVTKWIQKCCMWMRRNQKKTEITIRWKAKNVSDSQKNSKKLALLRFFAMELVYNDEFDVRCVFCPLSA